MDKCKSKAAEYEKVRLLNSQTLSVSVRSKTVISRMSLFWLGAVFLWGSYTRFQPWRGSMLEQRYTC